jgi:hypothetical protein
MRKVLRRALQWSPVSLLLLQFTGCGTILYSERHGQDRGRLDATVIILDGVGLFFFLVPGVIAFAVDFVTGAVYLPRGGTSDVDQILSSAEIREYPLAGRELGDIVALVEGEMGLEIDPRALQVVRGRADEAVETRLRELNARIAATRIGGRPAGG